MKYRTDKTLKLLEKLEDCVFTASRAASDMASEYTEMQYEYNRLEVADDFLTDDGDAGEFLARDFEDGIEAASDTLKSVHRELKEFDTALAKLIQLRGELAEETGIPMFSHLTGGKQWERYDHEYTM